MGPDEVAHWEEELRGFPLRDIETSPAISVQEVLAVEAGGGNVWGEGIPEVTDCDRSLQLFLCFMVGALCRSGDVTAITGL